MTAAIVATHPRREALLRHPAAWLIDPDQRVDGRNASNGGKVTARMPSQSPTFQTRPNMSVPDDATSRVRRKRMEIFAFLFLTAVVMPVLAVGTVGSYGLGVWIYQMIAGPPGPPPSPH
jgi:nitrate reductase NapE